LGTASESFANTISGVSTRDIIDLSALAYSTTPGSVGGGISYQNGQLLVTEGNVTVALTLAGLNASRVSEYHASEDAHGGAFITQVAPADATHYTLELRKRGGAASRSRPDFGPSVTMSTTPGPRRFFTRRSLSFVGGS
jgi:hypothetical protein